MVGLLSIGLSFLVKNDDSWKDILIGLGCGFIPTALTAYFIDLINISSENDKQKKLRTSFLWGIPNGLCLIAKAIIDTYHLSDSEIRISFIEEFKSSIENMKKIDVDDYDIMQYKQIRESLLKKLDNGLLLCKKGSNTILSNQYLLKIDGVFTEAEIFFIEDLRDKCDEIQRFSVICEIAEVIEILVDEMNENIPEIKKMFDKEVIIKNNHIQNWPKLLKNKEE